MRSDNEIRLSYYNDVKKAIINNGADSDIAEKLIEEYHLMDKLKKNLLFMEHYDPRDIAEEILFRSVCV